MMSRSCVVLPALLVTGLLLPACGHRPPPAPPAPVALPPAWGSSATAALAHADHSATAAAWAAALARPELQTLIDEGLAANPDLAVAQARLEQAEALAGIASAARLPTVDVVAGAGRGAVRPVPPADSYGLSGRISWELDLWGRVAANRRTAVAAADASAADLDAAAVSLAGAITRAWLELGLQERQVAVERDWRDSFLAAEALIAQRYQQGNGQATDVHLVRGELAQAEADVAFRERRRDAAARRLEILLGRYPTGTISGAALEADLPPMPAGLPSELLWRRADLRAAELRLFGADAAVQAARADLLPRIALTAQGGWRSSDLDQLVRPEHLFWNLAGEAVAPLFDGGRRRDEVRRSRARAEELRAQWRAAALGALREVETAVAAAAWAESELTASRSALGEAELAARGVADRYRDGLVDALDLLTATRTVITRRRRSVDLLRGIADLRIDLLLALGGPLPVAADH
jgi:NodT family efflux transporter outer membrane factor (OMF) lipoprotein